MSKLKNDTLIIIIPRKIIKLLSSKLFVNYYLSPVRVRNDPFTHVCFVSLFSHNFEPWELFSNLNNCSKSVWHIIVIWNIRVSRLLKVSFARSIFCRDVNFAFEWEPVKQSHLNSTINDSSQIKTIRKFELSLKPN